MTYTEGIEGSTYVETRIMSGCTMSDETVRRAIECLIGRVADADQCISIIMMAKIDSKRLCRLMMEVTGCITRAETVAMVAEVILATRQQDNAYA